MEDISAIISSEGVSVITFLTALMVEAARALGY